MDIIMNKIICLYLALIMLSSCTAAIDNTQPVITADSIEPNTTADEVVEAVQAEMNYPYFWIAEDGEGNIKLAEAGELIGYEEATESDLDILRRTITQQQSIDPILTAQEAANIAGDVLKHELGASEEELANMNLYLDSETWRIDDNYKPPYSYTVEINHTTAALESVFYIPTFDVEYAERILESPVDEAFEPIGMQDYIGLSGSWDLEHPKYPETIDKLTGELTNLLTDSQILQSAEIIDIEPAHNDTVDTIEFKISLNNNRVLTANRIFNTAMYTSFDFDGYPLRAYSFKYQDENPT